MTIEEVIREGERLTETQDNMDLKNKYDIWCNKAKILLEKIGFPEEKLREIKVKMHYTENEYSKEDTGKSILKALQDTVRFLEAVGTSIESEISKETAIVLIYRILSNFHKFFKIMFESPVHKKGTLEQETLRDVQIGNEYDLQRMVYSLLLPIFPTARQEVNSDNGYGGMRTDIYLEDYDIAVELKCTRSSMTEKKLIEEMGSDCFHYKADTIFFYIYDKNLCIENPEAFVKTFMRDKRENGKTIRAIIFQL